MANIHSQFNFDPDLTTKIKIIGIGGGGGNVINNMIQKGFTNVEYIAINTDAQALQNSMAETTIQVGSEFTQGLGAGARPEIGRKAIEGNRNIIKDAISDADVIFIIAGMGGGTGTGGVPVVAEIANESNIFSICLVSIPFKCEGPKRLKYAIEGISKIKEQCDGIVVVPNEQIIEVADEDTTLLEAFDQSNQILYKAARSLSDLISLPGLINLDLSDIRNTFKEDGITLFSYGSASGGNRAELATQKALDSSLLDCVEIDSAQKILVNITSGVNLGMKEMNAASSIIQKKVGDSTEIVLGTVLDESLEDKLRVSILPIGFGISIENNMVTFSSSNTTPKEAASQIISDIINDESFEKSTNEQRFELDVLVNVGNANSEDLVELYSALSDLYRAYGGKGLVLEDEDSQILDFEFDGVEP